MCDNSFAVSFQKICTRSVCIFSAGTLHHRFGKFLVNPIVTPFIGICQSRLWTLLEADVVELAGMCVERNIDIAQAAFLPDMSEDHAGQLVPALEMPAAIIPVEFVHNTLEFVSR